MEKANACDCGATFANNQLRLQRFIDRFGEINYEIVCTNCGTVAAGFYSKTEAINFWNEKLTKKGA